MFTLLEPGKAPDKLLKVLCFLHVRIVLLVEHRTTRESITGWWGMKSPWKNVNVLFPSKTVSKRYRRNCEATRKPNITFL